ncbi:CPBP family intramembrane glutamic endopeptidase [Bacillus salitolerans]|uniref:CPBP family intramembrane glutamic endopeptidase n=1 Tax=Bacillus salitolerans TaxID=1437434 RepID=A0ABW4LU02_9BACI
MKNQSEIIKQMTDREILFHLYMTQAVLFLIASIFAFFLFDSLEEVLFLFEKDGIEIFVYGGIAGISVVLLDLWLMKVFPISYFDDGGINKKVFENRSIFHIFVLCWIIAITEEWLFRGVIQTHLGLSLASILFAITHIRYLKKWLLFIIVTALSFLLGWLYEWTANLYVTIFAHFLIDFFFGVKIRMEYLKGKKR